MTLVRRLLQALAFFFPAPANIWLHRLAGGKVAGSARIHPGVLLFADRLEIGDHAKIKFGTMMRVRTLRLGRKTSLGFFILARGESDLVVGDASIIGPRTMINCSREVRIGYYSGVGPGGYLYTHGSGMPVTEGYRSVFAPITLGDKVWVSMRCVIGPGVAIGDGTQLMPGTVLLESVGPGRLVAGDPARLSNFPAFLVPRKPGLLEEVAEKVVTGFCEWSNEYRGTSWTVVEGVLRIPRRGRAVSIASRVGGDIVLLTVRGETAPGMYFNLADLSTDGASHPVKRDFEAYLRLYHGLIFL